MRTERPPFEHCFELGYFCHYELSHKMLEDSVANKKALVYAVEELKAQARCVIFGDLEPAQEQRDAYMDALCNLHPSQQPPPVPWEDWRAKPLPEPIYTNVRATDRATTVIAMVFGGWLKEEFRGAN